MFIRFNISLIRKIIVSGWAASFFSLLFGGDLKDFFSAFIIAAIMTFCLHKLSYFNLMFFIDNFLGAFIIFV